MKLIKIMTTTIYCKKDINEDGFLKLYKCPRLQTDTYFEDICSKCQYYIPNGQEVPAP